MGVDAVPLERDGELRSIDRVLAQSATEPGRLLVIEGPSGIGRSRLLEEVIGRARRAGRDVLSARAGELETGYPFEVVLRLFEPRLADDVENLLLGRGSMAAPLLAPQPTGPGTSVTNEAEIVRGLYRCIVDICQRRRLR